MSEDSPTHSQQSSKVPPHTLTSPAAKEKRVIQSGVLIKSINTPDCVILFLCFSPGGGEERAAAGGKVGIVRAAAGKEWKQ